MNKFYNEIDKALLSYESYCPYHTRSIDWICDRISWCWKWKKITHQEMERLCDRATKILNERNGVL